MKNKLCFIFALCFVLLFFSAVLPKETCAANNKEVQGLIDGIISFKMAETGSSSVQEWIDKDLAANAGMTAECYITALRQSGVNYDFSRYYEGLTKFIDENNVASASTRLKYALALVSIGQGGDRYVLPALEESIGRQGIMSWVFALHLYNNGVVGREHTRADITDTLLSLKLDDGGWALSGNNSDIDVTAMTIQALAPYYSAEPDIKEAIDAAIVFLSEKQLEDGDFSSYGVRNPESGAQVIAALCSVGIDCLKDERFIKNGKTLFDGLKLYKLKDGSFSHIYGEEYNHTATVQAFYSLIALTRAEKGLGPIYVFDEKPSEAPSETRETNTDGTQTVEQTETKKDYKIFLIVVALIFGAICAFIVYASFKAANKIKI